VLLATCRDVPRLDPDDQPLVGALASRGIAAVPAVWDDPAVDWAAADLVVIRSTWDYPTRRAEFLEWVRAVPRLANACDVVEWNTDKHYLRDLDRAGVPVVATAFFRPGDAVEFPASGEYVIKPAVGAGGLDTARYTPAESQLAARHAADLHAQGRAVLVQPYLSGVDVTGESALLFVGGCYSHSVGKAALLAGSDRDVDGLYRPESISPRVPDPAELAVAQLALAAVPGGPERLLYARVDLLPGPQGTPVLLELELTEPSLFLAHAPGAVGRLADAIAEAISRSAAGDR